MQEAGIPVTISYIADAHDNHMSANDQAFGPGQADYVAQLQSYDQAFAKFFARLKTDGIDEHNTLFIITSDENDHFAGGPPTPANCDGVHVACNYANIGELNVNLPGLLAVETGNTTPFSIHFDMAPTVNITGNPARTSSTTRKLERDFATLTALNPITNKTDTLTTALADPVELGLLHMITADPARTPSFIMFGDPDYFFQSFGSASPVEDPGFAWNHGGIQPEIIHTWLGLVGPGVRHGEDGASAVQFSDHTDIRPTILALLGLQDDYIHDGRVLFEALNPSALSQSLTAHRDTLLQLARVYKQINAPVGPLGLGSLTVSTAALASNSDDDEVYTRLEGKIASWQQQRDTIAHQMRALLEGAAFGGKPISEQQAKRLISQGQALLEQVASCAEEPSGCGR
jgi:arylsulfatase A-like enzyme